MRTIYLDSDFCCHANDDGTMIETQTDVFDGLCAGALECYRFIPAGHEWTRSDGQVFHGPFIQPCKSAEILDGIQRQYDADELARLTELGIPQEQDFTATRNYPSESFIGIHGELYEVIRSIPQYTSIIVNQNVIKTTVEHYLDTLKEE